MESTCIGDDDIKAARMLIQEVGHIKDVSIYHEPAVVLPCVLFHFFQIVYLAIGNLCFGCISLGHALLPLSFIAAPYLLIDCIDGATDVLPRISDEGLEAEVRIRRLVLRQLQDTSLQANAILTACTHSAKVCKNDER